MLKLFSFRTKVAFLLIVIAAGIYTLASIDNHSSSGSVYEKDGLLINYNTNKPHTGTVIDTIYNQIITYEVINGIKNGNFMVTLINGNKLISGKMNNNKNDGKWSYFYSTGQLESEGNFKNDLAVDKWTWFYPNGEKKEEGNFTNGKRNGIWKSYKEDGSLKSTLFFKKGKVINSFDLKDSVAS